MQKGCSYIKDSGDFINKTKNLSTIPDNAILVTLHLVGLNRRILHEAGLRVVRKTLENQHEKGIPTEELFKMEDFVSKNSYFEFNSKFKQQVSVAAIDTEFAPQCACIFMDKFESNFLKSQKL